MTPAIQKSLLQWTNFTWFTASRAVWDDMTDPGLNVMLDFPYWPLREDPALFQEFARLPVDQATFGRFALAYGPLFSLESPDRFSRWAEELNKMREAVDLLDGLVVNGLADRAKNQALLVTRINGGLACNEVFAAVAQNGLSFGAGVSAAFSVPSLAGAMWLQLANAAEGGIEYDVCVVCGKRFERRSNKNVCSDKCRSKQYYQTKTKKKRAAKGGETT